MNLGILLPNKLNCFLLLSLLIKQMTKDLVPPSIKILLKNLRNCLICRHLQLKIQVIPKYQSAMKRKKKKRWILPSQIRWQRRREKYQNNQRTVRKPIRIFSNSSLGMMIRYMRGIFNHQWKQFVIWWGKPQEVLIF